MAADQSVVSVGTVTDAINVHGPLHAAHAKLKMNHTKAPLTSASLPRRSLPMAKDCRNRRTLARSFYLISF
jgi:hypothetical protein